MIQSILDRLKNQPEEEPTWRRTYGPQPKPEQKPVLGPPTREEAIQSGSYRPPAASFSDHVRTLKADATRKEQEKQLLRLPGAAPIPDVGLIRPRISTDTPSLGASSTFAPTADIYAPPAAPAPQLRTPSRREQDILPPAPGLSPAPRYGAPPAGGLPVGMVPSVLPPVAAALGVGQAGINALGSAANSWLQGDNPIATGLRNIGNYLSTVDDKSQERADAFMRGDTVAGAMLQGKVNWATGEGLPNTPGGAGWKYAFEDTVREEEPLRKWINENMPGWVKSTVSGLGFIGNVVKGTTPQIALDQEGDVTVGRLAGTAIDTLKLLTQNAEAVAARYEGPNAKEGELLWGNLTLAPIMEFSPSKIVDAMTLVNGGYNDALARIEELRQSGDMTLEQENYARAFAYNGVPALNEYIEDIAFIDTRAAEAEREAQRLLQMANALPPGPDREQLEYQAAEKGAIASKLRNTSPWELWRKHENIWNAAITETLLDPLNAIDIFTDVLRISPMARRAAQGAAAIDVTADAAAQALQTGKGLNRPVSNVIASVAEALPGVGLTGRSQSAGETRDLWNAFMQLPGTLNFKEDLALVLRQFVLAPEALATGLPIASFVSPAAALKNAGGVIKFGPAALGDYRTVDAIKNLFGNTPQAIVEGLVNSMPSLRGTGPVNIPEFNSDLWKLFTRATAARAGVATADNVPVAAKSVTMIVDNNGQGVLQFWGNSRRAPLLESAPMAVEEAQVALNSAKQLLKNGDEYVPNWLRTAGELRRAITSALVLNNPLTLGSLAVNAIGNRLFAFIDGNLGIDNVGERLKWVQRQFDGIIPDDDIARYMGVLDGEDLSSMATREVGKFFNRVPLVSKIKGWRQLDDQFMRANIISKVFRDEYVRGMDFQLKPVLTQVLQGIGMTDPQELKLVVNSLVDIGKKDGMRALQEAFFALANGRGRLTMGAVNPNFIDFLPDTVVREMDRVLAQVNPQNLPQMRQEVLRLRDQWVNDIQAEMAKYGPPTPNRHYWTRQEMQADVVDLKTTLQVLNQKVPGININVQPIVDSLSNMQRAIAGDIRNIFLMNAQDSKTAPYLYAMLQRLATERTAVRQEITLLKQYGDTITDHQQKQLWWSMFAQDQVQKWDNYGKLAREIVDDTRLFLASDVWKTVPGAVTAKGIAPVDTFRWLGDLLNVEENKFFSVRPKGVVYSYDPEKIIIMDALHKAEDKFLGQMLTMLQRYPTDVNFDHYLSAIDDVQDYRRMYVSPPLGKADRNIRKGYAAIDAYKAKNPTITFLPPSEDPLKDPNVPHKLKEAVREAFREQAKVSTGVWKEFATYAFARYQSAAMMMADPSAQLPTFFPLNNWGGLQTTGGQGLKLVGFNPQKAGSFIVQNSKGVISSIDAKYVPQQAIDAIKDFSAKGHQALADQVGTFAAKLFDEGVGLPEIDQLIANVRKGGYKDVYDQLRLNVHAYLSTPPAGRVVPLFENVERETVRHAQGVFSQLLGGLDQAAQWNSRSLNALPMDAVTEFNTKVMPIFENIRFGALRAGKQKASFSVIDFMNEWGPDVLSGLFAPYLFWTTRMGKNVLERAIFNPGNFARWSRAIRWNEEQPLKEEGLPERARGTYDTGLDVADFTGAQTGEGASIRAGVDLARWLPVTPMMTFNGWVDTDMANTGQDYIREAMLEAGYPGQQQPTLYDWVMAGMPGGAKGLAGAALQVTSSAAALGFQGNPEIQMGLRLLAGQGNENSWSQFGTPFRLLGYANMWRTGEPGKFLGMNVGPFYDPYLAGRESANLQGDGTWDPQRAENARAVLQANYQGRPVDPAFLAQFPTAQADAQELYKMVGGRNFILGLLNSMLPVRFQIVDDAEVAARRDQSLVRNLGFSPENPYGGAAKNQVYDETSPNYNAGVAGRASAGQIMNEDANYIKQDGIQPPTMDADIMYYDVYRKQQSGIYDAADAKAADVRAQLGPATEANTYAVRDALAEQVYDPRKQALEELDAAMPREAERLKQGGEPGAMRGYRPEQAREKALETLKYQARENIGPEPQYPEGGTRAQVDDYNQAKAAWEQAWQQEYLRLTQDPAAVRAAFGTYEYIDQAITLPGGDAPQPVPIGPASLPGGAAPQPVPLNQTPVASLASAPGAATATAATNNQWAAQMQEQEGLYSLPPGILQALAQNESSFNPQAKSGAGAQGLMQFMPGTWAQVSKVLGLTDVNNPEQSIEAAAYYLRDIYDNLPEDKKSWQWALAAYNWGPGYVAKSPGWDVPYNKADPAKGGPPAETKAYVERILGSTPTGTPPVAAQGLAPFDGDYTLTQSFGVNPERYKSWGGHMGLDWSMPIGTELKSLGQGTVVGTGYSPAGGTPAMPGTGGFGNFVIVQLEDGTRVEYAHLDKINVKQGDVVKPGQVLGLSGHTGVSDFPHLHLGVRGPDGKYIDPAPYLATLQKAAPQQPIDNAVVTSEPAAAPTSGGINWGTDVMSVFNSADRPATALSTYEAERRDVKANVEQRSRDTYPEYMDLLAQWARLEDADRAIFRVQHPEIRAVNLQRNNIEGWTHIEQEWGKGAALRWARIPPSEYDGGNPGDRRQYYSQDPGAFLIKSWLEGRPEPVDPNRLPGDTTDWSYNNGKDYAEAQRLFGKDIWSVVEAYYRLPASDPGNRQTQAIRAAWYEANPQYQRWADWWYAKLPDRQVNNNRSFGYNSYGGWSGGSGWGFSGGGEPGPFRGFNFPETRLTAPPRWEGSSGSDQGGWRRWMEEGEQLLQWRR